VDFLRSSSAWLGGVQAASLSTAMFYRRTLEDGSTIESPWQVTAGETRSEVSTTQGMAVRVRLRDYIGSAAELTDGGISMPPQSGDRITDIDGTVYEVNELPAEGCWRWSDQFNQRIRVHTKEVAASE